MKFDTTPVDSGNFNVYPLETELLQSVATQLRQTTGEEQSIVHTGTVHLKMSEFNEAKRPSGHGTKGSDKKRVVDKDRKLNQELRTKLAASLNRNSPSVIQEHVVHGLKLTRNERKKIIAAISLAEGSFISTNPDTEFHMSDKRAKQIPVTYNKIVHIGLSWGLIQFTQDSGSLGGLLELMNSKNQTKFQNIFGDNANELMVVVLAHGMAGQDQWRHMSPAQKDEYRKSGKEMRGPRVQPIAVVKDGEKKDLWEEPWNGRFKQAGLDEEFQEVQLEYAVKKYLNEQHVVSFLKQAQVQTALGCALVVDRSIQWGPEVGAKKMKAFAKAANVTLPFTGPAEEKKLAEYLAQHGESTDHKRRVKLLLDDPYRLLTVNLYSWDTYGEEYDK